MIQFKTPRTRLGFLMRASAKKTPKSTRPNIQPTLANLRPTPADLLRAITEEAICLSATDGCNGSPAGKSWRPGPIVRWAAPYSLVRSSGGLIRWIALNLQIISGSSEQNQIRSGEAMTRCIFRAKEKRCRIYMECGTVKLGKNT